jgi:acyl carrier protein
MTRDDITAVLINELGRIAPEIDGTALDPDADLREELDIDSMDFLNLVTALKERLHIDIPEIDYSNLDRQLTSAGEVPNPTLPAGWRTA